MPNEEEKIIDSPKRKETDSPRNVEEEKPEEKNDKTEEEKEKTEDEEKDEKEKSNNKQNADPTSDSPHGLHYRSGDEPEPIELTHLNVEAAMMCLASKVSVTVSRITQPFIYFFAILTVLNCGHSRNLK